MEFKEMLLAHIQNLKKISEEDYIEEQTKMYFIAPFLNILGYNVFNPDDVVAEYVADIGAKKGEKVDYALKIDGNIEILIEAKAKNDTLENHDVQLKRYFNVTNAKIGILTNGIIYKFFTDLDEKNIMDNKPFLIIDLNDLTDDKIAELKKFTKTSYNTDSILDSAENLKYSNSMIAFLNRQLDSPDDQFIKLMGREICDQKMTQLKVESMKAIFKKTFKTFINDFARKKFESALQNSNLPSGNENDTTSNDPVSNEEVTSLNKKQIITTSTELEAFYIIKSILRKYINSDEITYKDTISYFGVLLNNRVTKWICRLYLDGSKMYISFPLESEDKKGKHEEKIQLNSLEDIYNYEDKLIKIVEDLTKENK